MAICRFYLLAILVCCALSSCLKNNVAQDSDLCENCLECYTNCDSVFNFDPSYSNHRENLQYARWQITKGDLNTGIQILDSLESLNSGSKKNKLYQEIILHQFSKQDI